MKRPWVSPFAVWVASFTLLALASAIGTWYMRGSPATDGPIPAAAATRLAIPVTATPVRVQDVPVYLSGLGTVQSLDLVTIRSQISGTLQAIPVQEGQIVRPGDVVAHIDAQTYRAALDQAQAQRSEDQAQLKAAEIDLRRYQQLVKGHFVSVQQLDNQQATVEKLRAAVQVDHAAIETAHINLDYCTIRSPVQGRVGLYQTQVGNLVQPSSQAGIVSIAQTQPISVIFTLPEQQLTRIQRAMANGAVAVEVFTNDANTKLAVGRLLTPDNSIDASTATIQLKAVFPNQDDRLWPGEFVRARARVDTLRHALTVPLPAIQHGPEGLFVYVVSPDSTVTARPVEVAYQDSSLAVVTSGLHRGDVVVTAGQSRLSPGARVSPRSPQARSGRGGPRPAASAAPAPKA